MFGQAAKLFWIFSTRKGDKAALPRKRNIWGKELDWLMKLGQKNGENLSRNFTRIVKTQLKKLHEKMWQKML